MSNRKLLTVWFNDENNLMERATNWNINPNTCKSEQGFDFQDKMSYKEIYNGSVSRVYFISDRNGREYNMFLDDFDDLIKARKFIDNKVEGTFRYVKCGQAQAIKLILENKTP